MCALVLVAVLSIASKFLHGLLDRIRVPALIGMIALGLVLGPTGLSLVYPSWKSYEIIKTFASLGVLLLLFMAGLETDLATMRRAGRLSLLTALGGMVLPFAAGFGISLLFDPHNIRGALVIGTILTATSVSISVLALMGLKKLNSVEGNTILGAAIIDDVVGIIILSVVLGLIGAGGASLGATLGLIAAYLIGAVILGWWGIPALLTLARKLAVPMGVTAIAVGTMLIYAWAAEEAHVAGITGAYLAGVFISRTTHRKQVLKHTEVLGHSLFFAVFFVFIGLQVDLRSGTFNWPFISLLVAAAIITKILGSGLMARLGGLGSRQAFAVGAGMVPRGEVALVIASLCMRYPEVFDSSGLTATVMLVIVSSTITPVLLSIGFGRPPKEGAHAH